MPAVIFDFDGVLADTEHLHLGAFQDVFSHRGWDLDEQAYFDRYLGHDDRGLIEAYARDNAYRLEAIDIELLLALKATAFRLRLASGVELFPGAHTCVRRLAAAFPLAVASGSLRAEVSDILASADLLTSFAAIVAAEDVVNTKPAPEPYLKAAALLGMDPAHCVAVEDSRAGLESARAAGMRTVALPTTSPRAALVSADRLIEGLDELTVELVEALASAHSS